MTLDVQTECVLVVPTSEFHALGYFQGFTADVERYLPRLLASELVSYRPRSEMEEDPSFKQLIPYCIFRHVDAQNRTWLFQYCRGRGQGEGRLHSKRSIGVGGHISLDDHQVGSGSPYDEGMRRELLEEVDIRTGYTQRCVGLINDDETPVGQVHLGVVHLFDVESPEVFPREADLLEAGFREIAGLVSTADQLESWSRISLEALFPLVEMG